MLVLVGLGQRIDLLSHAADCGEYRQAAGIAPKAGPLNSNTIGPDD